MERPNIKDSKVLKYVEELERQLQNFKSTKTIAKFYVGLKKQVDEVSDTFSQSEYEDDSGKMVPFKLLDLKSLTDKDDKLAERYFKFLEKSKPIIENLLWLEKQISPEDILDAKKEAGNLLDSVLHEENSSIP